MRIAFKSDTATPHLKRLLETARSPRTARTLLGAGAKAVQVAISKHLRALQARGNEKGWPAQKFFAGKATSVEKTVGISARSDDAVIVSIADPRFVHRLTGGTVKAKRAKYLAIPMTAQAYAAIGKGTLRESMPGLRFVKLRNGQRFLALGGKFIFALKESVTHSAHPEEAPDEKQLADAGLAGMDLAAKRLLLAA